MEDHVGDILGKARHMASIPAPAAARAAGLHLSQYDTLEQTGQCVRPINYPALAALVGLHPAKLERIAAGWTPAPVDLARWRHLCQVTTTDSGMSVHCYLAWDERTHEAALFDTGFDPQPVFDLVAHNQLRLRHLFITHCHDDHIGGAQAMQKRFPEIQTYPAVGAVGTTGPQPPASGWTLGSLRLVPRKSPGHTPDGMVYVVDGWPDAAPPAAIVGDTLFSGSMGRVAAAGALAKTKVRETLLSLPPPTLICPGHGPLTTVAEELENNPFF